MNKAGFNKQLGGDGLLYTVLIILLMFFIFNLSTIYQFVSSIKTGEAFKKEEQQGEVVEEVEKDDKEEEEYVVLKPIGKNYGKCSKVVTENGGDKTTTVKIYYTEYKLKSIAEEHKYSGISDEYMNYIYSENSKYKKRQTENIGNEGYSIVPTLSSSTSLKVSSVYDLSKTSLENIKLEENEKLDLVGAYNQEITELIDAYMNLGYECEWE